MEKRGDVGLGVVAVKRDAEPAGVVHDVDLAIVEKAMDKLGPGVAEGENPREPLKSPRADVKRGAPRERRPPANSLV